MQVTPPTPATRALDITLTKNLQSVTAGVCHLGLANALSIDGVDYIIVANTEAQLKALADRVGPDHALPSTHFYPVAVVHEAAVTLEDDEL